MSTTPVKIGEEIRDMVSLKRWQLEMRCRMSCQIRQTGRFRVSDISFEVRRWETKLAIEVSLVIGIRICLFLTLSAVFLLLLGHRIVVESCLLYWRVIRHTLESEWQSVDGIQHL